MNKIITDSIKRENEYTEILKTAHEQITKKNPLPILVTGLCEGARIAFYISLASDIKRLYGKGFLLIVPDEKQAIKIFNACTESKLNVFNYPARDFIFHNVTASHEYEHERLSVISAVVSDNYDIVIATPDAALQYTIPKDVFINTSLTVEIGSEYDMIELISFLDSSGYIRVDMVDGAGQYSVRGGILDIFPPKCEYPIRAEFFGDEIEKLDIFDILTQRRIENIQSVNITPAREILLNEAKKNELKKVITTQIKKTSDARTAEILRAEFEAAESGTELNFLDKYIILIYPERFCLLDYFDDVPLIITEEWNAVSDKLKSSEWHVRQSVTELLEEGTLSSKYADFNKWAVDYENYVENHPSVIVDTFATGMTGRRLSGIFNIPSKQTVSYADNIDLLREDLDSYIRGGFTVVMLCESETMAKNLRTILTDNNIHVVIANSAEPAPNIPCILSGVNFQGFELTVSRFTVMTMYANAGSYSRSVIAKKRKSHNKRSAKEKIMSYADLNTGDYVVHDNHGIGQYLGLENLTVDGVIKDFVKIKYAGSDVLYLPTNQLDIVSKYIGAHTEDGLLKLSRMGGTEWQKTKIRVKTAAKNMAKDLIKLYAQRLRMEGFAFYPDDDSQREFEEAFEFEETDGQLESTEEIKTDMEKAVPMDRLLCGDVGFGKTEVALRAAFKAVNASKQVAILVPTTILALQHYQTLLSRMRAFAINVDMLSRFRNTRQQQEIIRRLRRGEIDIIVGTHRLLSKDIVFKDLGLIIIDEEQRFGVTHKEKLKQLSHNIDALTLTATPIPRTLNMAMSGIRDMSILEEAPGDRLPVQTYVLEYDELIIGEAIKKELRRGGQVFYLHNRIVSINHAVSRIASMVPEAKIAIAHGKIDKEELSD
ncbi:MAG: CarD family transcriptional regulator, partial [Eubacteriales bacterium]|nr:CarD family transcriptional regulator [Eubacteriales bacterium]